jgi:hypothetical protein
MKVFHSRTEDKEFAGVFVRAPDSPSNLRPGRHERQAITTNPPLKSLMAGDFIGSGSPRIALL